MEADPILRVFGKATDSHRAMQSSARAPTAGNGAKATSRDHAQHSGAHNLPEPPNAENAAGMLLPSPAPRQRFAHHGYQAARQELEEWRHLAAAEAAEAEESSETAEPVLGRATPPQQGADASAVAAAEHAAKLAWQQAAQAAQQAAEQQAGRDGGAGLQQPPPVSAVPHPGCWPFPPWAANRQEPPPQPPPPPGFALGEYAEASAMQQSAASSGCDVQTEAPAAASDPQQWQNNDRPIGAVAGDEEMSSLLAAWYNAGFETGRHYERRRLQAQMQQHAVMPQSVS